MANNKLKFLGANAISKTLINYNSRIVNLNLKGNSIGDEGVKTLC